MLASGVAKLCRAVFAFTRTYFSIRLLALMLVYWRSCCNWESVRTIQATAAGVSVVTAAVPGSWKPKMSPSCIISTPQRPELYSSIAGILS